MIDYKQSSMVDIAFDLMKKKKKPVDFYKLWQEVSEIKGFSEADKDENESLFYTNITLDGRLITLLSSLITGKTYAAVLPVPVCAQAMMSLPSKMTGIVNSWTGVVSSKFMS